MTSVQVTKSLARPEAFGKVQHVQQDWEGSRAFSEEFAELHPNVLGLGLQTWKMVCEQTKPAIHIAYSSGSRKGRKYSFGIRKDLLQPEDGSEFLLTDTKSNV